ncbi:N-acetyltransferase [Myxococcus stipitatus]|uniref:N-acetyltransferase n=1 Tax=Myxococcus stipitatus TaxID=83455 RepID=UPI001F2A728A|nr:N-acetyltransferase [Myxococcus stipitatus]MCE9673825.1 N-acetyltransferase [Myxococcus stipitatus]
MHLERLRFKEINLADPFFDSLKAGYKEFPIWFAKKAEDFAYVFKNPQGTIDGFLYLKLENGPVSDTKPPLPSAHRLKVGTMKINAHGTKLGERFIKKIFDHAVFDKVEEVYVTVFSHHSPLIGLLERYGFHAAGTKESPNGTELVLVKQMKAAHADVVLDYPLIRLHDKRAYLLALHPQWHTRLLPDSILKNEDSDIVQDISHTNSIHKVYLAGMFGMEALRRGDVLLIYRTSDYQGAAHYRSVATSVCVVEEYRPIHSFETRDEFLTYCRPYSVFEEQELQRFWAERKYPHVVRFTYNLALRKRVTRKVMIEEVGLDSSARWGFMSLTHGQFVNIIRKGLTDEGLVIYQA